MKRFTTLSLILASTSLGSAQLLPQLLGLSAGATDSTPNTSSEPSPTTTQNQPVSPGTTTSADTQPTATSDTQQTTKSDDNNNNNNSNNNNNNNGGGRQHSANVAPQSSVPVATSYQITLPASTVVALSTDAAGQVFSSQSVIPASVSVVVSTIYSSSTPTVSTTPDADQQSSSGAPSTGVIVGSVCAFLAILIAGGVYAFFWKTRRPSNRQKARLYGGEEGKDDEAAVNMLDDDVPQYRTGPAPYYSYAPETPYMHTTPMSEPPLAVPARGYVSPELSSQRILLQRPNEI
ncbi:hypothetical protein INT43_008865 [Umbelopsis isabellina]|uniref:Mid2 domain-containing protein n=1 Tax=Mortierella isabellina TaxID=91625 RepID=A0A8H7UGX4_MORIS|nr:hypothetical protein INT43_008865 [Umbelopsis isabellina]